MGEQKCPYGCEGFLNRDSRCSACDGRIESRICYLTVYRVDQAYGGPEEGGWYYSTYELEASVPLRGKAFIRKVLVDDTDMYAGGYDPQMISEEEDGVYMTRTSVVEFDSLVDAERERKRLTDLYADAKGRMRDYSIFEEVHMGEMARLTRKRYC